MLFERRLQNGLLDGSIRLAFRRWQRQQVVAGRAYRSPIGMVDVLDVCTIAADAIPESDARAAGYASTRELLADLKGPTDTLIYRLELRKSPDADPWRVLADAAQLDAQTLADLERKLARLDAAAGRPWTLVTLQAIAANPGVRAGDLCGPLGWPVLADFKLHVRKLKALGLTLSLRVGYELSPRGHAYLRVHSAANTPLEAARP